MSPLRPAGTRASRDAARTHDGSPLCQPPPRLTRELVSFLVGVIVSPSR
ncbi:MAG: hypothetical protein ACK56F_16285 [bacterium]